MELKTYSFQVLQSTTVCIHSDFINAVNNALKLDGVKYGYNFIKNSNILPDNLWQDGLHVNSSGQGKPLNIFSVSLRIIFKQTFYPININSISSEI